MNRKANIDVEELSPDEFRVIIAEGHSATTHTVTVPEQPYLRLTNGATPKADFVAAAFRFLLDREPKESILSTFEIPLISRYFPDFERKLPDYLDR